MSRQIYDTLSKGYWYPIVKMNYGRNGNTSSAVFLLTGGTHWQARGVGTTFVSVMSDNRIANNPVCVSRIDTQYKHTLGYAIAGSYMTIYLRHTSNYSVPLCMTVFFKGVNANFDTPGNPVSEEPDGIVYLE